GRLGEEAEAGADLARGEVRARVRPGERPRRGERGEERQLVQAGAARPRGGREERALRTHARYRSGGAYMSPPCDQSLFTPRGRASGEFGPMFFSKLSP